MDFPTRGRRIEEQIALLRALWMQPTVTFNNEFHRSRVPIWTPLAKWCTGRRSMPHGTQHGRDEWPAALERGSR
jgi:hypothetical protein